MRAAYYQNHGAAKEVLKLGNFPIAKINDNQVLVRIYASGINHSDVKSRSGMRTKMDSEYVIPHSDGAGIIENVGDNISSSRIGERIWIYNANYNRNCGTASEYIVIDSDLCIPLPSNIDFNEGASLGVPAITAYNSVFAFGPVEGKTLLITGGAGRVGNYAIQIAKLAGATVVSTVSSKVKSECAYSAGADLVINYKSENIIEKIKNFSDQEIDHVIEVDFGSNISIYSEILKCGGTISAYGSHKAPRPIIDFYPLMFKNISMKFIYVYDLLKSKRQEATGHIIKMLEKNHLKTNIAHIFSLDQIITAHEFVENNDFIGSVIIKTDI